MSVLSLPRFHDEAAAFDYLESMVWADGVVCPHCGTVGGRVYKLEGVRSKPSKKNPEGIVRHGLKKCGECRKQFTAKVGTVFEDAKLPLHKMLQAAHLMMSSKKGISSHQLSRLLEVQYNSAWFLSHRIREAMRSGDLSAFGIGGGIVEVDETFIGRVKGAPAPHDKVAPGVIRRGQRRWPSPKASRAKMEFEVSETSALSHVAARYRFQVQGELI